MCTAEQQKQARQAIKLAKLEKLGAVLNDRWKKKFQAIDSKAEQQL